MSNKSRKKKKYETGITKTSCFLTIISGLAFIAGIAQAEIEKKNESRAYYQRLMDLHIIAATTEHKATCNDDIIKGWCAKYNMSKIEFEKVSN